MKQGKQAYSHIAAVLQRFGATMDDIVDETLFITDMGAIMGSEDKMAAFFGMRAEA